MKFANRLVNSLALTTILFLVAVPVAGTLGGCASVVAPQPVHGSASYDGNELNSGIVMSVPSGFVVTAKFRQRYNDLIAVYGGDFSPVLKPDSGLAPISDDRFLISKEGMVDFLTMNGWRRAGLRPKGQP